MKLIDTKNAVGHVLCHDMTQIIPGVTKDARFRKGHIVTEEDVPVLLSMGKEHLYVWEKTPGMLHENEAALRLLALCRNGNMRPTQVKEGKIELLAERDGLFRVDVERLNAVNDEDEIIVATRHNNSAVCAGDKLAGMRIIPLVIEEKKLKAAEEKVGGTPILSIHPWKRKTCGLVTTGSEVFHGRITDKFTPVIQQKLAEYGCEMAAHEICDDDDKSITAAINRMLDEGVEMVVCTGGMSVDPDDRTPLAIRNTGARIVSYGAPVLPGAAGWLEVLVDGVQVSQVPVYYAQTAEELTPERGFWKRIFGG